MLLNCFYRRHKMHIASEALALSHSATIFFAISNSHQPSRRNWTERGVYQRVFFSVIKRGLGNGAGGHKKNLVVCSQ